MKNLLAALMLVVFILPASAEDAPREGPGSVFTAPVSGGGEEDTDEEIEIHTDLDLFVSRGFTAAVWSVYDPLVAEVARDLVFPEYEKRTGRIAPADGMIEIATGMLTKQGFRDLLVMSRLPGDCRDDGCLIQVYSLIGKNWIKRTEFHALNAAWKSSSDDKGTTLAAIGDLDTPTRLLYWNGTEFNKN